MNIIQKIFNLYFIIKGTIYWSNIWDLELPFVSSTILSIIFFMPTFFLSIGYLHVDGVVVDEWDQTICVNICLIRPKNILQNFFAGASRPGRSNNFNDICKYTLENTWSLKLKIYHHYEYAPAVQPQEDEYGEDE